MNLSENVLSLRENIEKVRLVSFISSFGRWITMHNSIYLKVKLNGID